MGALVVAGVYENVPAATGVEAVVTVTSGAQGGWGGATCRPRVGS